MAQRLGLAKGRLGKGSVAVVAAALLVVLGLGGYIFYNTNVLNEYSTSKEREDQVAEYERKYRQYLRLPQPRVTAVDVRADLSPREGAIRFQGTYALKNKTGAPIPKLHVLIGGEPEEYELAFTPPATLEMEDEVSGYRIYALSQPLAPGAAMECRFDVAYGRKGFTNGGIDGTVIENGTFVNSGLLPSFGYEPNAELSDDDVRKKHALEPKPRMNPMSDAVARNDNYLSRDADWIDFKTTVCTSPDQIALAPGYLEREWDEDGKRCFAFAMDAPILHFFAMLSARFEVKKDSWTSPSGQVVAIEVYHHSGHPYNIEGMIEAVKKTLDYDTREFGPYQHRQLRIVEFPLGYGTFAQSFPNTVPFSEAIGFIARPDKDEDIDYTFYVTAHEVSHQWFAHQVIGANVQGATVTSESLSQYAALMVMEHEYGRPSMRKFLKHELSGYLIGRSGERKAENPLAMNENQQYIHYQKGSLVMYALREWMGEDQLNLALRNYLAKVKFQEPPYTTSLEMLDEIKAVAAPELHPFIDDLFLKISLWDLRMKEATWEKRPDGQYDVTMSWEAKQLQADAKGTETEVPLDLAIPVGVFLGTPKDLEELWFEKVPMKAGPGTLTVTVPKQPERVGIDPYHYLVDRNLDDNLAQVEEKSAVSS
jgi:hypothetical protein